MAAPTGLSAFLRARWDRLNGPGRVRGIDLARGVAVLGMLAAHLLWILPFDWADPATWIGVVHGRSSILFATLAGVSIGLLSGGAAPRVGRARRVVRLRLVVRAVVLWMLGIALIAFGAPVYVILPAYGLLFLLAIPLLGLGARALLVLAGVLALVMPFVYGAVAERAFWDTPAGEIAQAALGWEYPFLVWIAFVVAGMGLARLGIENLRVQRLALAAGILLAGIGYGLDAATGSGGGFGDAPYGQRVWTASDHSSGILEVVGSGGFAIAVIAGCLLLCRTAVSAVSLPLRAVGAMPLTAYTGQLVAWVVWATLAVGDVNDLEAFLELAPFWPVALVTMLACTAWALLVGRGPLEGVMDRLARLVPDRSERDRAVGRLTR